MYDEPFVGQDPIFAGVLRDLIRRINQAMGCTCIIVSHDIAGQLRFPITCMCCHRAGLSARARRKRS